LGRHHLRGRSFKRESDNAKVAPKKRMPLERTNVRRRSIKRIHRYTTVGAIWRFTVPVGRTYVRMRCPERTAGRTDVGYRQRMPPNLIVSQTFCEFMNSSKMGKGYGCPWDELT